MRQRHERMCSQSFRSAWPHSHRAKLGQMATASVASPCAAPTGPGEQVAGSSSHRIGPKTGAWIACQFVVSVAAAGTEMNMVPAATTLVRVMVAPAEDGAPTKVQKRAKFGKGKGRALPRLEHPAEVPPRNGVGDASEARLLRCLRSTSWQDAALLNSRPRTRAVHILGMQPMLPKLRLSS